jgi:hypothetical protein
MKFELEDRVVVIGQWYKGTVGTIVLYELVDNRYTVCYDKAIKEEYATFTVGYYPEEDLMKLTDIGESIYED